MNAVSQQTRNKLAIWRKILFYVGLGVGLLIFLRQVQASYEAIQRQEFLVFRPAWLLASLGLSLLTNFLQVLAWTMIMRYLVVPISLRQALRGYLLSFLPRYIPGGVWGYWSRSQWLKQFCGIDYATSVLGSVLEALTLITTALSVAGIYLYTCLTGLRRFVPAVTSVCLFFLTWLMVPRLVAQFTKLIGPRFARQFGNMEVLQSSPGKNRALRAWFVALLFYMALWVTYGGSILLIGDAVLSTPLRNLLGTMFSISVSWLSGFVIIFVPAGIGIREFTLSALLTSCLGLLPWQGGLVAVVSRFEAILSESIWLVVGTGIHVFYRHRGSEDCASHSQGERE